MSDYTDGGDMFDGLGGPGFGLGFLDIEEANTVSAIYRYVPPGLPNPHWLPMVFLGYVATSSLLVVRRAPIAAEWLALDGALPQFHTLRATGAPSREHIHDEIMGYIALWSSTTLNEISYRPPSIEAMDTLVRALGRDLSDTAVIYLQPELIPPGASMPPDVEQTRRINAYLAWALRETPADTIICEGRAAAAAVLSAFQGGTTEQVPTIYPKRGPAIITDEELALHMSRTREWGSSEYVFNADDLLKGYSDAVPEPETAFYRHTREDGDVVNVVRMVDPFPALMDLAEDEQTELPSIDLRTMWLRGQYLRAQLRHMDQQVNRDEDA